MVRDGAHQVFPGGEEFLDGELDPCVMEREHKTCVASKYNTNSKMKDYLMQSALNCKYTTFLCPE